MKRTICAMPLIVTLLCSCLSASTAPPANAPFSELQSISELTGVYRNLGESAENVAPVYLSQLIWPTDEALRHAEIQRVAVAERGTGVLEVKAMIDNKVVKVGNFVQNKDFAIESGKITLNRETGVAGFRVGEPLVGPYHGRTELGIDTGGQGKYRRHFSAAGLAYLIVPIAVSGSDNVRFVKLSDRED
ncbi:MAG: hypothetical protein RQ754_06990 [Desulfuromonadales bacterium]|nr:hypothetical protein [Desulfuromonadales bacterium]